MTNQGVQAAGDERFDAAQAVARSAGALALEYFRRVESLVVEHKGSQDLVSEADRETERHIRQELQSSFPGDAFMGEEHGYTEGSPGHGTWVVDPIDGTQPFLLGLPTWCISIAYVAGDRAQIGVIYNPATDELYCAQTGAGAFVNGVPIQGGGMYQRTGSGALNLAYVAAGKHIGYVETHIHAWDCLAAVCLIEEAGGRVSDFVTEFGVQGAGPLVAGSPGVFDQLMHLMPVPVRES